MATTPPETTTKSPSRTAQFGRDVVSETKRKAVRGIGEAAFGTGVIGGALRKAYESRFLKSEDDTRVDTALKTQESQLDQNNATLTRIEGIVLNISDNIYNLAGVWSTHVSSMEEARREQAERLSREKAAEEEGAREVSKVTAPTAAGTSPEKQESQGLLGKITGASKGLFGNFMKKFAMVAGVAAVGAGAVAATTSFFDDDPPDAEEVIDETDTQLEDTGPTPVPPPPPETPKTLMSGVQDGVGPMLDKVPPPPTMKDGVGPMLGGQPTPPRVSDGVGPMLGGQPPSGMSDGVGPMLGGSPPAPSPSTPPAPPPPTPAAPAPPVASTTPAAPKDDTESQISNLQKGIAGRKKYLERERKSKERQIAGWKKRNADKPEEEKQKYEDDARQRLRELEEELTADIQAKEKQIEELRAKQKSTPAAPSTSSSGGGTPASVGGSGSAGAGAAMPVTSSPSTGAQVAQASTNVAAASEAGSSSGMQVVSTSSTTGPKDGGLTSDTAIPSPLADRGSLDTGVFFRPGM